MTACNDKLLVALDHGEYAGSCIVDYPDVVAEFKAKHKRMGRLIKVMSCDDVDRLKREVKWK